MVVQIALALLGLSIGLGVMAPTSGALTGIGIGAGIWLVVSTLISLFIGGFVVARLAGLPTKPDGVLNGIVVWALATLLSLYLATTAVGTAVSGVAGILGQGFQVVTRAAMAVAPEAAEAVKKQPQQAQQAAQQAIKEAKQQYRQARQQAEQVLNQAQQQAVQTAKQAAPIAAGTALGGFVALVLGAIAAAIGGLAGTPKHMPAAKAR